MFEIDQSILPFVQTRQALLILDLQNEFVSADARIPVTQPESFVGDILKLVPDFRAGGIVIWVRSVFKATRPVNGVADGSEQVVTDNEVNAKPNQGGAAIPKSKRRISDSIGRRDRHGAIRARMVELAKSMEPDSDEDKEVFTDETFLTVPSGKDAEYVLPGTNAAQLCKEALEVREPGKDITFDKSYYSAFKDGTLVQILRARFVTEIYICGSLSNMSVYATAMDATQFGYAITLIDDCLGYRSQERHRATMRRLEVSTGCDNILSDDLLRELRQKSKTIQAKMPSPAPPRRGEGSKPQDKKPKEPELDSMLSKLNLTTGKDSKQGISTETQSRGPQAVAPPLVAENEKKSGSFQSNTTESHDIQLPPQLSSKSTPERHENPNKVPSKIRTRKRIPKKPAENLEPSLSATSAASHDKSHTNRETSQESVDLLDSKPKVVSEKSETSVKSSPESKSPALLTVQDPTRPKSPTRPQEEMPSSKPVKNSTEGASASNAICEGDTTIIHDLLQGELAEGIFERIRDEVRWQKMSHQGGDVPRLVAVQGKIDDDGSIPIYRHPADESPPLLPFSPTVSLIREQAEKELGHALNHVLIQFYRDGTDYISEHSDKTLDIVPKTYIVNVSLGAQRTMVFRTKKQPLPADKESTSPENPAPRQAVRAPMPHNSMCKVGLMTNMRWLHGIRQDKRLQSEKSNAELAYGGARISLTFRHIGTFLSKDQQKIWGQGAVSKSKEQANFVINGDTPEAEKMIRAFGQENHSSEFDWAGHYGAGFDVLHLNNSPKLFLSGDPNADLSIKLALQSFGIKWEEGKLSPSFKWKDGSLQPDAPEIPDNLPAKFIDNDLSKSTTVGDAAVLLYLNVVYGPQLRQQSETARLFSRLQIVEQLRRRAPLGDSVVDFASLKAELELLETYASEADHLACNDASIVDWALLPVLDHLYHRDQKLFDQELSALRAYFLRVRTSAAVINVLGAFQETVEEKGGKYYEAELKPGRRPGEKIAVDETRPDDDDDDDDEEEDDEDDDDEDDE